MSHHGRAADAAIAVLGLLMAGLHLARGIGWWLDHHTQTKLWKESEWE